MSFTAVSGTKSVQDDWVWVRAQGTPQRAWLSHEKLRAPGVAVTDPRLGHNITACIQCEEEV